MCFGWLIMILCHRKVFLCALLQPSYKVGLGRDLKRSPFASFPYGEAGSAVPPFLKASQWRFLSSLKQRVPAPEYPSGLEGSWSLFLLVLGLSSRCWNWSYDPSVVWKLLGALDWLNFKRDSSCFSPPRISLHTGPKGRLMQAKK